MFERSLVASLFCLLPLPLFYLLSTVYLFSVLHINFTMSNPSRKKPSAHPHNEEYCTMAILRQLRLLRDFCNDLPGWNRRHKYWAFVLVRCGTRRWDYRKSAIFTTVHSRARRTSEPETSLSLSWRKFVASSVLFRTHEYGETRIRTWSVSKTEIRSRHGKRKNQDSPWRQKEQILAEVRTGIQKHDFQADSDRRSIQDLTGIIDSHRKEIDHPIASDEQPRWDQLLLQEQLSEQNRDLREAHIKCLHEMEELKRVQ